MPELPMSGQVALVAGASKGIGAATAEAFAAAGAAVVLGARDLAALTDVARWTGSSSNNQPWRFLVVCDRAILDWIAEVGTPQTRPLRVAPAAIAIVLPADPAPALAWLGRFIATPFDDLVDADI